MLHRTYSRTAQHILSYAQTMRGGGVERALLRMADGWLRSGRRVTLVLGSDAGPLSSEIPQGVELIHLHDARYSALFGLAGQVRRVRPDLIFCPGNHYSAIAGLTRLRLGRGSPPIVAKVSNALVRPEQKGMEAWAYRRWLRLHPRFIDHVVAMGNAWATGAFRWEIRKRAAFANDPMNLLAVDAVIRRSLERLNLEASALAEDPPGVVEITTAVALSYLGIALAFSHQLATGTEFVGKPGARGITNN